MEDGNVSEEAKLDRKIASDVGTIEVDTGNNGDIRIIEGLGAEDTIISAYFGADPIASEVERVRVDGFLPCLEGDVGTAKARIGETDTDLDFKLEVIGEVSILWKSKELATSDEGCFSIGEGRGWKDER